MHEKIQELIDHTAAKFQLSGFYLKRYHIFEEENQKNERTYIFNMEWFPENITEGEDGSNPSGTVSIDLDFHTKALKNIIFVNGVNKLATSLPEANDPERAIEWVEQETGLEFGRQFKLTDNNTTALYFHAAADNIPVFPSGHIHLKFNDEEKLSLFSIHGMFPDADKITWEPFDLTDEDTEEIVKNQCALFEVPVVDKEKWQNIYGISSSFITNAEGNVLSYEEVEADASFTKLETILEWHTAADKEFALKEINLGTESTLEAALANEQPGSNKPITVEEQENILSLVRDFLQSTFPADSGKWEAISAKRDASYLFIELRLAGGDTRILQRKLKVVLDAITFKLINYIDNLALLNTFQAFTKAADPVVSQEEAYEKLSKYVEITPVYVYDKQQDTYRLCGKVHCDYAIDAETGELLPFDDLN